MKKLALISAAVLLLAACSSDTGSDEGDDTGSSTGGTASGSGGEGSGPGGATTGGAATGGAEASGGEPSSTGGDASGSGGEDAATGGADAGTGGDTGGNPFAGTCTGTPMAAVATKCEGITDPMSCSPLEGCVDVGTCAPKQTQNQCSLRALNGCGSGSGTNNCHILGDNPNNFICAQTERAAACGSQYGQGACLGWDGTGIPAMDANVCNWEAPDTFSCQALPCEGAQFKQLCDGMSGCTWTPE